MRQQVVPNSTRGKNPIANSRQIWKFELAKLPDRQASRQTGTGGERERERKCDGGTFKLAAGEAHSPGVICKRCPTSTRRAFVWVTEQRSFRFALHTQTPPGCGPVCVCVGCVGIRAIEVL